MEKRNYKVYILKGLFTILLVCCSLIPARMRCMAAVKVEVNQFTEEKIVTQKFTKSKFLKMNDCTTKNKIITNYDDSKKLRAEVYYNTKKQKGCGIYYRGKKAYGFTFEGCEELEEFQTDVYSLKPAAWNTDLDVILKGYEGLKKSVKKNKDGKILRYKATGIFDIDWVTLADVRLTYDKKGRLAMKQAYYLPQLYHTIATDLKYYYNTNEQLVYETGTWDGGEYHNFYSYKKKTANTPNYELSFSWQGTGSSIYATLYH